MNTNHQLVEDERLHQCPPSLMIFTNNLASQIPLPQLKHHEHYNLVKGNNEVKRLLNSKDSALLKGLEEIMSSGREIESYQIELNSTIARLNSVNLKTAQTSTLMKSFVTQDSKRKKPLIGIKVEPSKHTPVETTPVKSRKNTREVKSSEKQQKRSTKERKSLDVDINGKVLAEMMSTSGEELENLEAVLDEIFTWESNKMTDNSITFSLIEKLDREVSLAIKRKYLNKVAQETVTRLVQVLVSESSHADACIVDCESDLEKLSNQNESIQRLIHTSIVILRVLSAPKISKETATEETLDAITNGLKTLLNKYLYPSIAGGTEEVKEKKSKVTKSSFTNPYSPQICEIFYLFVELLKKMKLKDDVVLRLSDSALSTFFVEEIKSIQLSALNVATFIFSTYLEHRTSMLHEIITSVLRLPNDKRAVKTYKLENATAIQMFTSLMLQLIQSCGASPSLASEGVTKLISFEDTMQDDDSQEYFGTKIDDATMQSLYDQSLSCAKVFVEFFLTRCSNTSVDGDNRNIVEHFVDDLMTALDLPAWPAADLVLQALIRHMCEEYLQKDKKKSEKMRMLCVDVLGKVASFAKSQEQEAKQVWEYSTSEDEEQVYQSQDTEKPQRTRSSKNPAYKKLVMDLNQRYALDISDHKKIILFCHLSSLVKRQQSAYYARQYSICQWLWDSVRDENKSLYVDLWNKEPQEFANCKFSMKEVQEAYLFVLYKRKDSIINRFDYVFKAIIEMMQDDKVKVRSKAMKGLQNVVTIDPSLLAQSYVRNGILERSLDQAISVREAVIDLIGKTILTKDTVPDEFFINLIIKRVRDSGLSVRKRAITILGNMCNENKNMSEKHVIEICRALSNRLNSDNNEEDTVKKLVLKAFENVWFTDLSKSETEPVALQIVDVIAKQKCEIQQFKEHWLVQLIKTSSVDTIEQSIKWIFDHILHHAIDLQQSENEQQETEQRSDDIGRGNLTSCFQLLHLICFADPKYGTPHFKPICNFLDDRYTQCNPPKTFLITHVASIISMVLPHISKPDQSHKTKLQNKLIYFMFTATNMNAEATESCAKCLAALCEKANEPSFMTRTLSLIFDKLSLTANALAQGRLLVCLGLMVKHFDFDKHEPSQDYLSKVCGKLLQLAESRIDTNIVRSLFYVLMKRPTLFRNARISDVIRKALNEKSSESVQTAALLGLSDFLYGEQLKMEVQGTTGQNQDAGTTTSIMSAYIHEIMKLSESKLDTTRLSALKVIEQVAKQGLYIPELIIPTVVSLEADPMPAIREKAHALNRFFQTRYQKILAANAAKGVVHSYSLLKKSYVSENVSGLRSLAVGHFNDFYRAVIKEFPKKERKSFLVGLMRDIFKYFDSRAKDRLYFIRYMLEVVAYLPYTHLYEVGQVIVSISSYVDEKGEEMVNQFKAKLPKDDDNEESDDDYDPLSSVVNVGLYDTVQNSVAIFMLIQTKQYLQEAYTMSNKKVEEFMNNESSKTYERQCTANQTTRVTLDCFVKMIQTTMALKPDDVFEKTYQELYKICRSKLIEHMHQGFDISSRAAKRRTPPKKASRSKKPSPKTKATRGKKRKRTKKDSDEEDEWVSGDSDNDKDEDLNTSAHSTTSSTSNTSHMNTSTEHEDDDDGSRPQVVTRGDARKRRRRSENTEE